LIESTGASLTAHDRRLARLQRMSWWLDEVIRVPGTRIRIGLDPILGLIPGLGDVVGGFLSAAIVMESLRRGVPRSTVVRIVTNIILDTTIGAVPVLGDLFDFAWKSNRRNLDLLERHVVHPSKAQHSDRLWVTTVFGLLGVVCAGLLTGFAFLVGAIVKLIGA
jgi:hypothetical protein